MVVLGIVTMREMKYHYIKTIDISSTNSYYFDVDGIFHWCMRKQYFVISEIVVTRIAYKKLIRANFQTIISKQTREKKWVKKLFEKQILIVIHIFCRCMCFETDNRYKDYYDTGK